MEAFADEGVVVLRALQSTASRMNITWAWHTLYSVILSCFEQKLECDLSLIEEEGKENTTVN